MKHTAIKLITLWMAVILLVTLSACSQPSTSSTPSTTASQTTAKTGAATTATTEDPFALPVLPLQEPVTLTVLNIERSGFDEECIINQKLRELTGIILDNTWVAGEDFATKQNVSLSAGIKYDLTVLTNTANRTTKDLATEMGEQEMIVNFNDYIQYMPNLQLLDETLPSWRPQMEDANGNIYMYTSATSVLGSFNGAMTYYTWMVSEESFNALDLDDPTTTDDLTHVLKTLKEAYPEAYPLLTIDIGKFSSTFGVGGLTGGGLFWNPDTDQYEIGALKEEFHEMLTYVHSLYKDELLDPEFATMSGDQLNDKLVNNKGFMYAGFTGDTFVIGDPAVAVNPDFGLHSIDPLSHNGNAGKYEYYSGGINTDWIVVVDAASEYKKEALAFLDFQLSQECINLISWGIEGETFELVNGQPQYLPTIKTKANPTGTTDISDYMSTTNLGIGVLPSSEFYSSVSMGWDQKSTDAMMYFTKNFDTLGQKLPNFSLVLEADENEIASNIRTQINTYLDENVIKFITGDIELTDEQWSQFIGTIESLDSQKLVDIYNDRLAQTPKW